MKASLFSITVLLASTSAFAIDAVSMEKHRQSQPIYHKSCSIVVPNHDDSEFGKKINEILKAKGFAVKEHNEIAKNFKPGLISALSSSRREKAEKKHNVKNCENLKETLSLDFDKMVEQHGVFKSHVKISQHSFPRPCEDMFPGEILLKEEQRKAEVSYAKPVLAAGEKWEDRIKVLHEKAFHDAVSDLPACVIDNTVVTMDPNLALPTGAPLPIEEISIDEQERSQTKDLNLRELERSEAIMRQIRSQSR